MSHTQHARLVGLASLALLSACQAPGPSTPGSPRPSAPARVGSSTAPVATSSPLLGQSASPAVVPPAKLGIPARVNLNIPASLLGQSAATLLGKDGASLLANDGGSLIANDGAALIANDGSSLIANDGAGIVGSGGGNLIANDGAGIVGSGGGNLRTLQQAKVDPGTQLLLQLSAAKLTPGLAAPSNLVLYGWQVISINTLLKSIGGLRWASKQPQAVVSSFRLLNGGEERVLANVVAVPGRLGEDGKAIPTFWFYDVREAVRDHLSQGGPLPMRPETPFMALEILGEGKGRAVWRPTIKLNSQMRLAFATTFDLKANQSLAEAMMVQGDQELRHFRWAFDTVKGHLRVRASVRVEGASVEAAEVQRRLVLQVEEGNGAVFSLQSAPAGGPFAWVTDAAGSLGGTPTFFALDPQGVLEGQRDEGPRVDESLPGAMRFPGLGALDDQIPPRAGQEPFDRADFAFPAGDRPQAGPVVINEAMRQEFGASATP